MKKLLIEIAHVLMIAGKWLLNWILTIIFVIILAVAVVLMCGFLVCPLIACAITHNPTWIILYLPILGLMLTIDYKSKR